MKWPKQIWQGGLSLAAGLALSANPARADEGIVPVGFIQRAQPATVQLPVSVESLPASVREAVQKVVSAPTLVARAAPERFDGSPEVYTWLLDHPDRTASAWKKLGVPCAPIGVSGPGRYYYNDPTGNDLRWSLICSTKEVRMWYAEGHAKPTAVLPLVPVRVLAVIRHTLAEGEHGGITHQAEVFVQTDSRAAALVTKMLGPAVPRMAEQGAGQLLMFFSVLTRYLDRHPDQIETLLAGEAKPTE